MLYRLSVPDWVLQHNSHSYASSQAVPAAVIEQLRQGLARFNHPDPEVSIVIPAYNEEENILKTLSSFAAMHSSYRTELLVINNNSTDATAQLCQACGVKVIDQPVQGISYTRQRGLEEARGTYLLSADADSIYHHGWLDSYVDLLKNPAVACVYGRYSFIPSEGTPRAVLGVYEMAAEAYFSWRSRSKPFLNVMGFNSAFRREDGLAVGGYNTTRPRWSDGWMAMLLQQQRGQLVLSPRFENRVWTSDRRLRADGSLSKAFFNRVKKSIPLLNK